jgi:hypothetical protein
MSSKKRSGAKTDKRKGYKIICKIERIEEFDLKDDDEEQIVLVTTDTIGMIDVSCKMNMRDGRRKITLKHADNLVITPDPSVQIWAQEVGGTGGIKMCV